MTGDSNSTPAERLKGSVKEALGTLTGDARIEAEGRLQKGEPRGSEATKPEKPAGRDRR